MKFSDWLSQWHHETRDECHHGCHWQRKNIVRNKHINTQKLSHKPKQVKPK